MMAPDFWEDREKAQSVMQKLTGIKDQIRDFIKIQQENEDLEVLYELIYEENEESMLPDLAKGLKDMTEKLEALELETLLYGPYDKNNAILSLHAGAGGTEAQDWVQMLYRMYMRWCEDHQYKVEILDYLDGEEAGIKSVTILVKGLNAYGYLRGEKGVHRLIRISPFDSSGRRHTSFASLDVLPEINDDEGIEINETELKIDTYRAGGAGGQHVNKTDSAVRITHLPTGIVVQCQNERSQHANKIAAMRILKAKLMEVKIQKQEDELVELRGEQMDIGFGSQIRTYTFHPYNLVKDHRTSVETGNAGGVMDGNITPFINAYLHAMVARR
jgi:peptide chain release factor 2